MVRNIGKPPLQNLRDAGFRHGCIYLGVTFGECWSCFNGLSRHAGGGAIIHKDDALAPRGVMYDVRDLTCTVDKFGASGSIRKM